MHWLKKTNEFDADKLPLSEVIQRITKLNAGIQKFWSKSRGWAPIEAAGLLAKSRLDWQVSLSEALALWVGRGPFRQAN
jgi:hypothetical protein